MSRRAGLVWIAALVFATMDVGQVAAQPPGAGTGSQPSAEAHGTPTTPPADEAATSTGAEARPKASGERWGDGRVDQDPRDAPARGEPYRWRQMFFAALLMLAMLGGVVLIVRRSKRAR